MSGKVEFLLNQKLEIEMEDGIYKSNIQDVDEENIGISVPVNDGRYVPLRKGEKVTCIYYFNKDIYKFDTVVVGRKVEKLLIIMLRKPDKVVLYQRRNFARVPMMVNVYCGFIEKNGGMSQKENEQAEFFDAYTLDVSGGGMRVALDRSLEDKIRMKKWLMVTIPMDDEHITIKGEIVRIENERKNPKIICGLSFVDLNRNSREAIIRLVFKTMREQMRKGAKEE